MRDNALGVLWREGKREKTFSIVSGLCLRDHIRACVRLSLVNQTLSEMGSGL